MEEDREEILWTLHLAYVRGCKGGVKEGGRRGVEEVRKLD